MLVRDIELVPAIVDLIDNSVDGAKRLAAQAKPAKSKGSRKPRKPKTADEIDLSGHHVKIALDENSFLIEDDCGGIEIDLVLGYAFRFGRPDDIEPLVA